MAVLIRTVLMLAAPLAIVIAVVLYGGSYLKLSTKIKVLIILGAVVIWLAIILWKWWSARKRAKAIEQGLLAQAHSGTNRASPAQRTHCAEFEKNLAEAIAAIKRGPQGKRTLYTIPWYMLIGPAATGKTTAIVNSGLNFPGLTMRAKMRGTGGTRSCDPWISTDAVLLDTAGRYAQSDDRSETEEEWFAFLHLLRKSRGKAPINGLILAYSVETVIEKGDVAIVDDARELRQRMDEMLDHLGWSFPVYLLFTKCDLISGFVEFFENLSPIERQHVWGSTVPLAPAADQAAGEHFTEEFDLLLRRLRDVRTRRMVGGGRGESWGKLFLFPEELSAIRSKLHLFVETLFEPNPFRKDAPLFRGFYLSSGKQVGQPFEVAVRKIQTLLGISGPGGGFGAEHVEREDAYFVRDIFAKVLRADREVASRTTTASQKLARWRLIGTAALVVVSVLMSVLIGGYSYASLTRKMDHARKRAEEARATAGTGPTIATLERLEALRKETKSGWRAGFLTAPGSAREKADEIYRTIARQEVFEPLEERVASRLSNASTLDSDAARRLLRAELHLVRTGTEGIGREKELPGTLAREAITDAEETARAEEALNGLVEAFLKENKPIAAGREYELRAGAERLRDSHAPEPFFAGIVSGASREVPDLTVQSLASGQTILASDAHVRAAFSKAGWEKSVSRDMNEVAKLIDEDKRLLALMQVAPSERAPTKEQLLGLYAESFADEWARFFRSIHLSRYDSCSDAEDDFKKLQSPGGSPIVKLLHSSAEVTRLGTVLGLGGQEPIAKAFEPLHALVKGSDKEPARLDDYLAHLESVADQIADCANEDEYEPQKSVFRKGRQWALEFADEFPSSRTVGEAIETFLVMPIDVAEPLCPPTPDSTDFKARAAAEKAAEKLAEDLDKLPTPYPLGSSSKQATVDDVKAIFGSESVEGAQLVIEDFQKKWIDTDQLKWTADFSEWIKRAEKVRKALSVDKDDLSAPFTITVSELRSNGTPVGNANLKLIDRITILVNGERVVALAPFGTYEAKWTTADEPSSIVLEYTRANQKIAGQSAPQGIWSWFQLLDMASGGERENPMKVTWTFEEAGIEVDALVKMRGDECYFAKGSPFRRIDLPQNPTEQP